MCGGSADGGRDVLVLSLIGQVGWKVDKRGFVYPHVEMLGNAVGVDFGGSYDGRDKGHEKILAFTHSSCVNPEFSMVERSKLSIKVEERGPCLSYLF
jgi:hypothetical protein